jgi:hypothetical protein
MKKSAIAVLVLSMFAASSAMAASTSESSFNGYLNSLTSSPGSSTTTTANIQLSSGHYFSPQLVGRFVLFENVSRSADSSGNITSDTGMLALGGGLKYYFSSPAKGNWVGYGFGDLSLLSVTSTSTSSYTIGNVLYTSTSTSTGSGTQLDVGVGAANFITEDISMDIDVKSLSQSYTIAGSSISQAGFQFDVGFTVRF